MEYWICSKEVQLGPYSLQQLESLWQDGQLTSDTYYYDSVQAKWLLLRSLIESNRSLFSVEEAFVRLGQNRQKGCLSVYNLKEALHIFVEQGFVVHAQGSEEKGEFALAQALRLEESTYVWFDDAPAPEKTLRLNIPEYALKNSIARDIRVGSAAASKRNTVAFPVSLFEKAEPKLRFNYVLSRTDGPAATFKLTKNTNVVGREDHCDVIINDGQVSRKHCLLEVWEQNVKVKDLDSSNGTFINGTPVQDGFLREGDQLSFGSYKMILQKEQKKAPAIA